MLEIVFDGSSEGGLRAARYIGSCIILNKENELDSIELPNEEDKEIIRNNASFILGNRDFKCVNYEYGLDTGDLGVSLSDLKRKTYIIDRIMQAKYYSYDSESREHCCNALEEISNAVENHESIRIWVSNNASSMCGFYDLCSRLKDYDGAIFVVQPPEKPLYESCWGFLKPVDRYKYAENEYKISKTRLNEYAEKWNILKTENSNLRMLIDGKLKSVEDNYFDNIIYDSFEIEDSASAGVEQAHILRRTMELAHEALLILDNSLIGLRIDALIKDKKVLILKDNNNKFQRVLKLQ